jgi:hypothetical protein
MSHELIARIFTVRTLIRAACTALSLSSIGVAHSQPLSQQISVQASHQGSQAHDTFASVR